jgi:hypothetical protein
MWPVSGRQRRVTKQPSSQPLATRFAPQEVSPSMGFTRGSVREPGSRTLPFGVGFVVFSTSSKKLQTPPEWVGTLLRTFFALRKQSIPQVTPVEEISPADCRGLLAACRGLPAATPYRRKATNARSRVVWLCRHRGSIHLRAFPARLQAELAAWGHPAEGAGCP